MKTLIVREGFTLGANDYPRGAEISDPAIITMVKESHPGHVHDSQVDVDETPAVEVPAADQVVAEQQQPDAQTLQGRGRGGRQT